MNKYSEPSLEVIKFDSEDVITTSPIVPGTDETPVNN